MIRRGGGLARGFIQLAVEEKKIAGGESRGDFGFLKFWVLRLSEGSSRRSKSARY